MMLTHIRSFALAAMTMVFSAGALQATPEAANQAAASSSAIRISFKLDPRLTQSLYMGERWVSPPIYRTTVQVGNEVAVEARAKVLDAAGKSMDISPEWIPENPGMVAVSPGQGKQVKITVQGAGESKLKVSAPGFSRELSIKATDKDNTLQVEISQ